MDIWEEHYDSVPVPDDGSGKEGIEEGNEYSTNDELELHRLYQVRYYDFPGMTRNFYGPFDDSNVEGKRKREEKVDSGESTNPADVDQTVPRRKFFRVVTRNTGRDSNFI